MVGNRSPGTSLFDLLARSWSLEEEIVQTEFNRTDTAVLFRLKSGKTALVTNKDPESPKSRTRIEADTGRTTIRQRKNPIPEARMLPVMSKPGLPAIRFGEQGFLVVDVDGVPRHITAHGQCIDKTDSFLNSTILSLCSSQNGEVLAVAGPSSICIHKTADMQVLMEIDIDRPIDCMAFSATHDFLAIGGEGSITLIDTRNPTAPQRHIQGIDKVSQISWSASGSHLACTANSHSFWLVDITSETVQQVEGYPGQVSVAAFSTTGKALVTSGAFRLAGWSTDNLPHDDLPGTPLSTGKAGMVVINTVAAHPSRALVAVGYPDGLVTITSIGTAQEMMVHKEEATEVSQLSWSGTGEHLSIGFKSGKASVVTFPDKLFK